MEQTYIIPVKTKHYIGADVLNTDNCPLANAIKDFKKKFKYIGVRASHVLLSLGADVFNFKMEGWHECKPKTMTAMQDFGEIHNRIEFIEKNIIKANNGEEIETVNVTLTLFNSCKDLNNEIYID